MELLTTLGIDWQLMIVQLINFAILLAVLVTLVYRPLLRVIDDRRERVRKSMEDTKAIENQRRELDEFKLEQMKKIDVEAGKLLEETRKHAEQLKKDMAANAEKEAAGIVQKMHKQMAEERAGMVRELQGTLAKVVVQVAQKVIEREFSSGDQDRLLKDLEKTLPTLLT